jgi:DNA polymerase III delta prime subunit
MEVISIAKPHRNQRFLICGAPGTGKTTSALSFPNVIVANGDNKLPPKHWNYPDGIPTMDFFNPQYLTEALQQPLGGIKQNLPDPARALNKMLRTIAVQFPAETTLVIDSLTWFQDAAYSVFDNEPQLTKENKIDDRAIWANIRDWYGEFLFAITKLSCRVVVICHEEPEEDDKGRLNGRYRPLTIGKTRNIIASKFTDVVHQIVVQERSPLGNPIGKPKFLWEIRPSERMGLTSSLPNSIEQPTVEATWQAWSKLAGMEDAPTTLAPAEGVNKEQTSTSILTTK